MRIELTTYLRRCISVMPRIVTHTVIASTNRDDHTDSAARAFMARLSFLVELIFARTNDSVRSRTYPIQR